MADIIPHFLNKKNDDNKVWVTYEIVEGAGKTTTYANDIERHTIFRFAINGIFGYMYFNFGTPMSLKVRKGTKIRIEAFPRKNFKFGSYSITERTPKKEMFYSEVLEFTAEKYTRISTHFISRL